MRKISHFTLSNVTKSIFFSFLLIIVLWLVSWLICTGLQKAGCPLPKITIDKFLDLGFFALSNFSFITFLSMVAFQTAEGKLSPGFYLQTIQRPWFHFGMYVLLNSFILCYLIYSVFRGRISNELSSQLFIAIVASIVFAIIFHRHQTLRHLYHPLIVYESLTKLMDQESNEQLWLNLYECTLKAIKDHRISDALDFCKLMALLYTRAPESITSSFREALRSLYSSAKEQHPLAAYFEKQWPFVREISE